MSLSPRFFEPRFTYGDHVAATAASAIVDRATAKQAKRPVAVKSPHRKQGKP